MKKSAVFLLVLVAIALVPAGAQTEASAGSSGSEIQRAPNGPPEVLPSEIRGTVSIYGWTGEASQIKVHALASGAESPDNGRSAPDPRAVERTAVLTATADPHVFGFSIMGLRPFAAYRLAIELPPSPVQPKVFWRGLMGGLAVAGRPAVALEGFVARTEVEIRDSQGNWVGADDLQFNDPAAALRTLRWKSSNPGVIGGELQISTRKFPIKGSFGSCDEPAGGLIYRQQFPVRGDAWQEIGSLDFAQILRTGGRTAPPSDVIPPGVSAAANLTASQSSDVSPISSHDLKMLALGAPLYLRVVPVTERGRVCNIREDGVHGWVILAKLRKPPSQALPPAPPSPHLQALFQRYVPPQYPELVSARHPNMGGDSAYYVIKDHRLPPCKSWEYGKSFACASSSGLKWQFDELSKSWKLIPGWDPLGQILVDANNEKLAPNTILYTGTEFYYIIIVTKTGSCSGFCIVGQVFEGLVTAAVTGFGNFVTYIAEAYESIKDGVANVVADVVTWFPLIGDACNAVVSCQDLIKGGIEIGLASMGLPPSLPNWNQLKQQGMDYLTAEVASQMASATGLPPQVTNLAADQAMQLAQDMAQKTMDAMTRNQGAENGPDYDWVLPHSGMDPAVWTIWISKNPSVTLPPDLFLRTFAWATFTDYLTSANPFTDNLYLPAEVHLPAAFPASNILSIPLVLQPDYSTVPPPRCYAVPGYPITCFPNPNPLNIPICQTAYGAPGWTYQDCRYWGNTVGVYYRDYWLDHRLNRFDDCFNLVAGAYTKKDSPLEEIVNQLTDPFYNPWLPYTPPFTTFATIPATETALWNQPFYIAPACN